ncbi:MAG: RIO1 family regulatory kinase/ATPase [Anaerolineales bacterium]
MNTQDYIEFFEELDDEDALDAFLQFDAQRPRYPKGRISKKLEAEERTFIRAQDTHRANLKFTYKAARFEEGWLLDSLVGFFEQQWISDVMRKVKGGKEASVYQCSAGKALPAKQAAVKVYHPRMIRNLRNDHLYREGRENLDDEGRVVRDDGKLKAMRQRTQYGKDLLHQSWIAYEFTALQSLHAAGADVPEPYTMAGNAILMGFVGDVSETAPALNEIDLDHDQARLLFERVIHNIDLMLANDVIHGDLSAYNILYWEGQIVLIDFPQVISPRVNRNAFRIFERDVARVCEYFNEQGVETDPYKLARELWTSHGLRLRQEIHPRLLDADDPEDRQLWQKQK